MKNVIIDTGPIVALFDKDDKYHKTAVKFFKDFQDRLITTWPVVTEVSYMLNFNVKAQCSFFEWIRLHAVSIYDIRNDHVKDIINLLSRYSNVPMDLADASILLVAEEKGISDILSFDSDYYIYKLNKKKTFNNLLNGHY